MDTCYRIVICIRGMNDYNLVFEKSLLQSSSILILKCYKSNANIYDICRYCESRIKT